VKINDDLLDALRYLVMQLPTFHEKDEPDERVEHPAQAAFRESLARRKGKGNRRIGGAIPV
jgi:hypothetical protein